MAMQTDSDYSSHIGHVYLFGAAKVEVSGRTVALPGGRATILFAYLCLHPAREHSREALIETLWPERAPASGRRALSDTLYRLRRSPVGDWIAATPTQIQLADPERLWVDVWAFEQATTKRAKVTEATAVSALYEHAVTLYQGDLLEGCYDDWLLARRYALRERYLDCLLQAGEEMERIGEFALARRYFLRLIGEDPLREQACLGFMRTLALDGRIAEALAAFGELTTRLSSELGVDPSAESKQLAQRLRAEQSSITRDGAIGAAPDDNLLRPTFVGRQQERRHLLGAVEEAIRGSGQTVAVEGAAGMGKSRLFDEIAAGATWRGAVVAQGAASDRPAASPFSALAQAATAALTGLPAAQLEAILPNHTRVGFSPLYSPWATLQAQDELPPDAARLRLHTAIVDVFSALTALTPHVLVLDDLHWATEDQWAALGALVAQAAHMRLLILIGYRRTEVERGPGWEQLQHWERNGWLAPYRLEPLTPEELAALLPPPFRVEAAKIHSISGGNPFFVTETLLGLQAEQRAYRLTVEKRLAQLRADERTVLEAAAVIGDGASYTLWHATGDTDATTLARISRRLSDAYFLQMNEDGCRFHHDLVRTAVYEQMDPKTGRRLHARAAAALAQQQPDAIQLRAFHLAAAGENEAAAAMYWAVSQAALAVTAYADAQRALHRSLTLAPPSSPQERLERWTELARISAITGDREVQWTSLAAAQQLAADLDDQEAALVLQIDSAHSAFLAGDQAEADKLLDQAEESARRTANQAALCAVYLHRGDVALHFGDNQAAVEALECALEIARRIDHRAHEGRALDGLAWAYTNLNKPPERCLPLYEQAIDAQVAAGNHFEEARARINYLSGLQDLGRWDRAAALADDTLVAQQRIGYIRGEGAVRQARGLIALALGDYEAAQKETEAARTIFTRIGERLGHIIATVSLGNIAYCLNDPATAETLLREALHEAEELDATLFMAFALQDLGIQLVEQARPAEAIPLLRRAIAAWHTTGERLNRYHCETHLALALLESGDAEVTTLADSLWHSFRQDDVTGERLQHWYGSLARLMGALGRAEERAAALTAAYEELHRQARAIEDHDIRRRFYEAVAVNRAIVDEHDDLTHIQRRISMVLAREDAPLGRTLQPDELVTVRWTILGPEAETIPDKVDARRYRMQRLMAEAAEQGAAPTDHDLATALGVSRRTILRDLAAMEAAGIAIRTRGRI